MARAELVKPGKTLGRIEGFAGLRPSDLAYKVRRAALTATAVVALISGLAAAAVASQGDAEAGVDAGDPGQPVVALSPTGFAWRDGIRPGQVVLAIGESGSDGGWFIATADPAGTYRSAEADHDRTLRDSLPLALLALALGAVAVLFLRTRRRWVIPAAATAVLAAALPMSLHGDPLGSTLVLGTAAFLPVAAFAVRLGWRLRTAAIASLGALVAVWAAARLGGWPIAPEAEAYRGAAAFWATTALVMERGAIAVMTGQALGILRPRLWDLGLIAGCLIVAVGATMLFRLPAIVPLIAGALLLAVVPAARHRLGRPLEAVLFADVREQAAADAAERERARLAREIHDVPLQELVAVIRRLEIRPGAEAETESLRALAGHLRNVATELRPPVLDDLGLPAALDYLAEQSSTPGLPVSAIVDDRTGFGEEHRPPTDVELALYRIASEAVGNAIRHAGGSTIRIEAAVAPDRVELLVADDGAGIAPERARDAARRKRLGLSSMRRRAEAIDAELSIDGSGPGTRVRVVWQA